MSDKLFCPFCQQEIRKIHPTYFFCDNCRIAGEDKLWQELITTRKALDIAKTKLNGIHRLYSHAFYNREDWLQVCMEMVDKANTALEQINEITKGNK